MAPDVPFFVPSITSEDKRAVVEALESRWLATGPKATEFERMFADFVGTKYAVSVNSCTAALHLSMRALDIGPGGEVITPVLTFAATANAPLFCGAKTVFADVDERNLNISPEEISDKITENTRAIIVVHYGGQPCDMADIMEIADEEGIPVVEDCAHSVGAVYGGRRVGSLGVTGCFSFYATKNMTTFEGGMITTDDEAMARRMRVLMSQGVSRAAYEREKTGSWSYDVVDLGYNYRLNEVQSSLGISQLGRLDGMNRRRRDIAHHYTDRLSGIPGIVPPYEAENRGHDYHLYVIKVLKDEFGIDRDELFDRLSSKGIGLSVHYTPLHLLSFYKEKLGYKEGDFPVAERLYGEILSLPIYPQLKEEQVDYVTQQIEAHGSRSAIH